MDLGTYTESAEKHRLSGMIERRGSQTGLSTGGTFAFGLPFVGFGVFFTLVGMKCVPVNPSSVHAPYWVLMAAGLVVALGGLMLWSMTWKQFQSNRRRAQAVEHHVNEPALEDYDWHPRGFQSHCWVKTAKTIAGTGFLALFLSMFNWWAWFAAGPVMVKIILSLFDLIFVFVGWQAVMTISRAFKFGDSEIEFVRFPYRVNDSINIRWLTPRGIGRTTKGSFTLRCVKEWTETTGTGSNRSQVIVHEEQWNGAWSLDRAEEFPAGKTVDLEFKPPAGMPATCLNSGQPVFWEFEVNLDLPGPDFKEKYLVPVY